MYDILVRGAVCLCGRTPVPVSPHTMRGTAVLGDAAACPHTQKRLPGKRPTHQHAAQLEISVLCNYSQEP